MAATHKHLTKAPWALDPSKLVCEDIADVIASLLEFKDRGLVTDATVWATNPK